MTFDEFLNHCLACGGNLGAMLLTGIKALFPEDFEAVNEHYNSMDFSHGGIEPFGYLCDWLTAHGIVLEG